MPALSPTMTSGNIGTWQKNIGDAIAPGDSLVEIETDKAQMDFEYQEDGILAKILKPSGSKDIAVGNVGSIMHLVHLPSSGVFMGHAAFTLISVMTNMVFYSRLLLSWRRRQMYPPLKTILLRVLEEGPRRNLRILPNLQSLRRNL